MGSNYEIEDTKINYTVKYSMVINFEMFESATALEFFLRTKYFFDNSQGYHH